jgi:hypothetical protein
MTAPDIPDIKAQIAREIFIALQRRGADKLLPIIDSYRRDRLSNAELLALLAEYNATGKVLHQRPLP